MSRVRITTQSDEAGYHEDGSWYPASGERLPFRYTSGDALSFDVKAGQVNVANFAISSEKGLGDGGYEAEGEYEFDELESADGSGGPVSQDSHMNGSAEFDEAAATDADDSNEVTPSSASMICQPACMPMSSITSAPTGSDSSRAM